MPHQVTPIVHIAGLRLAHDYHVGVQRDTEPALLQFLLRLLPTVVRWVERLQHDLGVVLTHAHCLVPDGTHGIPQPWYVNVEALVVVRAAVLPTLYPFEEDRIPVQVKRPAIGPPRIALRVRYPMGVHVHVLSDVLDVDLSTTIRVALNERSRALALVRVHHNPAVVEPLHYVVVPDITRCWNEWFHSPCTSKLFVQYMIRSAASCSSSSLIARVTSSHGISENR